MQPSGRPVGKPHLTQEEWARGDQFANSAPTGGASKKDCKNSTLLSLKKSHVRPLSAKQTFLVFWFFAAFQFQTIQIQRTSKRKSVSKLFAWGLPAAKPRKWLPPNGVTVAPVKSRICDKHGLRGPGPQEAFPKKPAGRPRPATEAVAASRRRWPRPLESLVLGKSPF